MKLDKKGNEVLSIMNNSLEIARRYLNLPQHTVFRRKTNEPVPVTAVRLRNVKETACAAWNGYISIKDIKRNDERQPETSLDPLQDWAVSSADHRLYLKIGLMEPGPEILHGYAGLRIEDKVEVESLYSAPWNYAAGQGFLAGQSTILSEIFWQQTADHDRLAVKGVGWTLMAIMSSYVYILKCHSLVRYPITLEMTDEATSFYRDVLGMKCHGWLKLLLQENRTGEFDRKRIERFIQRAWEGELKGAPGWQSD